MGSEWLRGTFSALRPPPKLSLSEWADEHFVLSAGSAAEPGRWRTLPYQRGIMDAITDPAVERITWMKSARVGATKIMCATIGYHMDHDPCPILLVQPTVEDAEGFSKEDISDMLRDTPVLRELVAQPTSRNSAQTILHKRFPGGSLSLAGANSGRGFRRVSRRVVIFDEVDGYPPSAGTEGDQIKLGMRRSEFYWNRKIIAASTPLLQGVSRIEPMFLAGDQRRFHVPCPHCGHMDYLVFREGDRGHWMAWPDGDPAAAHFVCSKNGCIIEHKDKRKMLDGGRWIAEEEFAGHASFHIWAAYSVSPNATWGHLAAEFLAAKDAGPAQLQVFVNTALGETWHQRGEAPAWDRLYERRKSYPVGTIPVEPLALTAGVDVQRDRLIYEVVAWLADKQSYSVDAAILMGDPAKRDVWDRLEQDALNRSFPGPASEHKVKMLAVDSSDQTQIVYNWARRHPMTRVIAVKGAGPSAKTFVGTPSAVDVTVSGKRIQNGYKVWMVGVSMGKGELYAWLRLPAPLDGEDYPPGYCHFPEHPPEFFRQLTAEHLVQVKKRTGHVALEWARLPGRENHWLDARIYARAAATVLGLDRYRPKTSAPSPAPAAQEEPAQPSRARPRRKSRKGDGWFSRRRRR